MILHVVVTPPKVRHQSQTERDLQGLAARKERAQSPARGVEVAAPDFVEEEFTGRFDGDELDAKRDTRDPKDRIGRLEKKHDKLVEIVGDVRVELGKVSGQLEVLPELISVVRKSAERAETRHDKRDDREAEDEADARKHKRERITKIIGGLFSAGVLGAVVHWLAS